MVTAAYSPLINGSERRPFFSTLDAPRLSRCLLSERARFDFRTHPPVLVPACRPVLDAETVFRPKRYIRIEQKKDRARLRSGLQTTKNPVFCQPGGSYYSPDRVGARVAELMRNAGLQGVSLHSLRHSPASILLSKVCRPPLSPNASVMRIRTSRFRSTAMLSRRSPAPPPRYGMTRWPTSLVPALAHVSRAEPPAC